MSARTGILFATPGSTCPTAADVYDHLERAASHRFPGVTPHWCFTSGPVRRKRAAQGLPAQDPAGALAVLQAEGYTHVAVMPLHLANGLEFRELAEQVSAWAHRPGTALTVAMGHALLTSDADWKRTLQALLASLSQAPGEHDRVILAVHGSQDPEGQRTLQEAARLCGTVDPRLMLGMLLGKPDLADVLRACTAAGVRKAWLLPCMMVAGYSAREVITGSGEQAWAVALQRAGIETIPVIRGLGEIPGVVAVWMDHLEHLLAALAAPPQHPESP